jgi:hypothetical protein
MPNAFFNRLNSSIKEGISMAALQSTDYVALNAFANNGDRVGYWSYLASKGDAYSNLALGVATNETVAGYIANNFFLSQARGAGLNLTETQIYKIGVDLMKADLAVRQLHFAQGDPDGGLKLKPQDVYNYHDAVFKDDTDGRLDGRAWTGELALRDALSEGTRTGDYSRAESIWSNMQSSSFWTQASSMDSVPSGQEGAAWKLNVAGSVVSFQSTALIGNPMAEFSLRNTGQIDGWSQSGDGQWYRYLSGSNVDIMGNSTGFSPEKIYADPGTSDRLNQVQQVRQQLYGSSAIHVADGSNSHEGGTQGSFVYDSRGYLVEADALRNDGGSEKSVFDVGGQPWSSDTSQFDAYQRLQSQRIVLDNGGQQVNQYDSNNTHPYDKLDVTKDPTGKVTAAQVTLDPSVLAAGMSIGQIFGSALGGALGGNSLVGNLAGSTIGGLIGSRFVQVLATAMTTDLSTVSVNDLFAGQGVSVANAGIGAVSSARPDRIFVRPPRLPVFRWRGLRDLPKDGAGRR